MSHERTHWFYMVPGGETSNHLHYCTVFGKHRRDIRSSLLASDKGHRLTAWATKLDIAGIQKRERKILAFILISKGLYQNSGVARLGDRASRVLRNEGIGKGRSEKLPALQGTRFGAAPAVQEEQDHGSKVVVVEVVERVAVRTCLVGEACIGAAVTPERAHRIIGDASQATPGLAQDGW
ncbi:hypothetical protein BDM02DRAFT_3127979 [Thelephora ganbajun]|uniref:Uncharacterized protein n=1 Tax=Thelephora ganbajun TaxID=370292 RepID=A0ACB6ZJK6_THEGA|nr:hypothetical protein BDM02DRAFT_3127979 [Thelephora ganbajun]